MVTIRLHNTKTRVKEDFTPIDPLNVRMYVCGPTVYDRAHLGNGRPVVVFDVLYRLLRHVYGPDHVTYARNFTDVDDKINATAQARKAAGDARPKRRVSCRSRLAAPAIPAPDACKDCADHAPRPRDAPGDVAGRAGQPPLSTRLQRSPCRC